jgi:hypothetical protein
VPHGLSVHIFIWVDYLCLDRYIELFCKAHQSIQNRKCRSRVCTCIFAIFERDTCPLVTRSDLNTNIARVWVLGFTLHEGKRRVGIVG